MCGRYTLTDTDKLAKRFNLAKLKDLHPNYNVAPAQIMPIITESDDGRELELMKWGIPRKLFLNGKSVQKELINTRADKAFSSFWKKAVSGRRCLVPATGFYEWDRILDNGNVKGKQPYIIHPKQIDMFAFAGIWDLWQDDKGQELKTYSILTTEPNKEMATIHNRMPVILHQDDEAAWLAPSHNDDYDAIGALLRPYEDGGLEMREASSDVNNPRNNYPELLYPVSA